MMSMQSSVLRLSLLTVAAWSLALSPWAASQPAGQGLGRGGDGLGGRQPEVSWRVDSLNLSAEQREQIRTLRLEKASALEKMRSDLRDARTKLRSGSEQPEAHERDLRALFDEQQRLHTEHSKARFELMLAIRNVLTPEQRQEFANLKQERRDQRAERRGNRRGNR